MLNILHGESGLVAGDYEKRLTGRFALPNRKNRRLDM
jgi:hypothetical protein